MHGQMRQPQRLFSRHLEQDVDDEDVEHVLERDDDAIEDRLQLWNPGKNTMKLIMRL
jgi:hypothetical protein